VLQAQNGLEGTSHKFLGDNDPLSYKARHSVDVSAAAPI